MIDNEDTVICRFCFALPPSMRVNKVTGEFACDCRSGKFLEIECEDGYLVTFWLSSGGEFICEFGSSFDEYMKTGKPAKPFGFQFGEEDALKFFGDGLIFLGGQPKEKK